MRWKNWDTLLKNLKKSVKIEMLTENREEFFMKKNLFKLIGGGQSPNNLS
mgnify:CR=1 FL=1